MASDKSVTLDDRDGAVRRGAATRSRYVGNILWLAVFEAAYFIAYRYGMSFSDAVAPPFWFPDAILLCALLKSRPRHWWIFIPGALPIHLFSEVSRDIPPWFLLGAFVVDAAKAAAAAFLLRRYIVNPLRPETVRDIVLFMAVAMFGVPIVAAFAGAGLRVFGGYDFWDSWQREFFSDLLAQLVVTPFILYWVFDIPWRYWRRRLRMEGAFVLVALVITGYLAANTAPNSVYFAEAGFYLPVPFLFWAAMRFGLPGAAGAVVIMSIFTVEAAIAGRGPFAGQSPAATALSLQNFLLLRSAPLYIVAVSLERTRSAFRAARESEARFRRMAHDAPVLIWMAGTDALCNFFNQVWLDFTGRPLKQECGAGWAEGVHPDDLKYCMDTYHAAFSARRPFEMEYRLRRHDGEYRWILDKGVPRHEPDGAFSGYIGSAIDITDLKRAEEVNRALAHAQRLAVMGELTSAIAHEVRQPLTAISLNAQAAVTLLGSQSPPLEDLRETVSDIREGVVRADAVISRIRSFMNKQELQKRTVDIGTVVGDVIWLASGDITRRGVRVSVELDPSLPPVIADPTQLQQVLLNLVVNGMQAMNELPDTERILVLRTRPGRKGYAEVSVIDRGRGIAADRMARLFESFFSTRRDGMGLGLSIARSIVTSHGGYIWAENNLERGAAFHFTIPVDDSEAATESAGSAGS